MLLAGIEDKVAKSEKSTVNRTPPNDRSDKLRAVSQHQRQRQRLHSKGWQCAVADGTSALLFCTLQQSVSVFSYEQVQ